MTDTLERPAIADPDLSLLDFAIPCAKPDCEHTADWWNICLACGAHTPLCEPHRRAEVMRAEVADVHELAFCPECDCAVPARLWRRLFAFVPIGRP